MADVIPGAVQRGLARKLYEKRKIVALEYHGGTNFGRTTGGPYITTSYDYDAPLDEYGNIRQPKWGHLKELHASIKMMEKAILFGDMRNTSIGNGSNVSKFFGEHITPGCLLSNENTTTDISVEFQGKNYFFLAWSVSILPDCNEEVYNTDKELPLERRADVPIIISVAQFRPEKAHTLQPEAFSLAIQRLDPDLPKPKLQFVHSCRHEEDLERLQKLKDESRKLNMEKHVEFHQDVQVSST